MFKDSLLAQDGTATSKATLIISRLTACILKFLLLLVDLCVVSATALGCSFVGSSIFSDSCSFLSSIMATHKTAVVAAFAN